MRLWSDDIPRWWIWSLLGILFFTAAVYGPALRNPFLHFDDSVLITQNAAVQELTPRTLGYIFSSYDPELYDPLTLLSYQIEIAVFGMHAWVFHATNLLLHLLSSVLVALIALRLTRSSLAAILASAIFAFHPLNAEAILWASARKDTLSACLELLSVFFFLRWREEETPSTYVWSCLAYVFALFSKVHAVVVPGLMLCIDAIEGRLHGKNFVRSYLPYAALAFIFVVIAVIGKMHVIGGASMGVSLLLLLKSAAFYLWKFLIPFGFSILYPQEAVSIMGSLMSAIVVIVLCAIAWFTQRRWPVVTIGIVWYGIALIPSVGSFTKNGFLFFASDRYAYVAMIGPAMILGWLVARFITQRIASVLIVAISCVLLFQTYAQTRVWKNEEALFAHAVALYPSAALGWNNLGAEQLIAGRTGEAINSFQKAIEQMPSYTVPYRNLAHIAFEAGDVTESLRRYEQAAEVLRSKEIWTSDDVSTYASYALLLENVGRSKDGFAILSEALRRAPQFGETHYNVGIKLQQQGKLADALLLLQEAVRLSPRSADAWYHYAGVAAELGQLPQAADALDKVLWLDPSNANARRHREDIQKMIGK